MLSRWVGGVSFKRAHAKKRMWLRVSSEQWVKRCETAMQTMWRWQGSTARSNLPQARTERELMRGTRRLARGWCPVREQTAPRRWLKWYGLPLLRPLQQQQNSHQDGCRRVTRMMTGNCWVTSWELCAFGVQPKSMLAAFWQVESYLKNGPCSNKLITEKLAQ